MIVITITAILAATAIPSYLKYLQRASLSEAVSALAEYKIALGVFWSTIGNLPTTGDILTSTPADLPFGTLVNTNLPASIESVQLTASGNGILITLIIKANIFATLPTNNRSLFLGAKGNGHELEFTCGNLSTDAATATDFGFIDRTMLPAGCNFNGVAAWLAL